MELQPQPQTIDEALRWHFSFHDSVVSHRATILAAFHAGTSLPGLFFGLTYNEIDSFFVAEHAEVASMSIVNIVAAAEAAIRADFGDRLRTNYKDPLSRAYITFFQSLSSRKRVRPDFDERGILDKLKVSGAISAHLITRFRHALRVRHWYAHGRYWLLKSDASDSPSDIHGICHDLINALPA